MPVAEGRLVLTTSIWRQSPARNHMIRHPQLHGLTPFPAVVVPKYTQPWQQKHFCHGLYSMGFVTSTPPAAIGSFQSLADPKFVPFF